MKSSRVRELPTGVDLGERTNGLGEREEGPRGTQRGSLVGMAVSADRKL
ncbi:hypothetical protein AKJ08_1791 [Vulgatibacter incomptus]|uniref:Uncharacterized protein n=1 Tax=Vulgatibacter incomptus TaxID=1391653 RepID=A0A0K1PE52_9BACT|nr:hypothetical protein AKJ08_1791 [Vulgatibacter incomptus]